MHPDDLLPDAYLDDQPQEVGVDAATFMEACRRDFNFLASAAMPLVFKFLWPVFYFSAFELIKEALRKRGDFTKFAFGFPRGFAKSTFVKIVILWAILFSGKRYVLIIGSNEAKAASILADVEAMLDEPNIKAVFGDWRQLMETDTKTKKKFSLRGRKIILAAVGRGGSVRGLLENHSRPDIMVFDDIQEREEADSENEFQKLNSWFFGTALKACSPEGCLFIFLANMYPTPFSMLRKLRRLPNWVKYVTGAINSEGKSIWPELQPTHQLVQEFLDDQAAGQAATFLAEKMNDEDATQSNYLDLDLIKYWNGIPGVDFPQGKFIVIDPATKKKTSDLNCIEYFEMFDGRPVLQDIDFGRWSPKELISKSLQMAAKHNCRLLCVEATAYQESLLFWFEEVTKQLGIDGFFFRPVYRTGVSKNSDILRSFKSLMAGEWLLGQKPKQHYIHQAMSFNPLKEKNIDEFIDLPCYAPKVVQQYPELVRLNDYEMSEATAPDMACVEDNSIV